jgi:epoxyqueuosine reductase QueG
MLDPYQGLANKAAAVLINTPIVPDKPIDFGLQSFCRHCKTCAETCPETCPCKAIS